MALDIQVQLREVEEEERRLQLELTCRQEEALASSELLAATKDQEQEALRGILEMCANCEELVRKLRQPQDAGDGSARSVAQLELEATLAEESVAAAEANLEATRRSHAASRRAESQREAARAADAAANSGHQHAEVLARGRVEELAFEQKWEDAVRRAQEEADDAVEAVRRQLFEELQSVRQEAHEERAELLQISGSPRERLAETEGALAAAKGHGAAAEAEAKRLATALSARRKEEMAVSVRVQQLTTEAISLEETSTVEAGRARRSREELQQEEARHASELQSLLGQLRQLKEEDTRPNEATDEALSSMQLCREAVAQLRRCIVLAEAAAETGAGEEGEPAHSQAEERHAEAELLESEVARLRVERQQLAELGNALRAQLRLERATASHGQEPTEQSQEIDPERPQLLRAALRALLAENRSLQARLESASDPQGSSGPTSSRPSGWRPSSASRGTRLGKAGGASAESSAAEPPSERPASPPLELRGVPPTPAAAAGALPGPGGFMRQPLAPDEAVRLPRSATDRGTASQRKALERLHAAQSRHDEAAEAAAAQRQKLLPLIRWHDAARADAAAADRQESPGD